MQVVDQKAIEAVSERLRDTKRSVRRDAAVHLMAVFRLAACAAYGRKVAFLYSTMLCSSQNQHCAAPSARPMWPQSLQRVCPRQAPTAWIIAGRTVQSCARVQW